MKVIGEIPDDREVGDAVNRGVPVTVVHPRSPAAKAIEDIAELLLPGAQPAERKGAGNGDAKVEVDDGRRSAVRRPQSLRKAGASKFSKQKDKKAA